MEVEGLGPLARPTSACLPLPFAETFPRPEEEAGL